MTHVNRGLKVAGLFCVCTSMLKTTVGDNINYSFGECLQTLMHGTVCVLMRCVCVFTAKLGGKLSAASLTIWPLSLRITGCATYHSHSIKKLLISLSTAITAGTGDGHDRTGEGGRRREREEGRQIGKERR